MFLNIESLENMLDRYIGLDRAITEESLVKHAREEFNLEIDSFKGVSDFVNSYHLDEDFNINDWRS